MAVCETSATAGGWYTTDGPEVPDSAPGPVSDQFTSFASGSGVAVISVGPEMFCAPLGLMLRVTGVWSLLEHAVKIKDTAARIRVRIDASAQVHHAPTKLSGTLLFPGSVDLSTPVGQ